MTEMIATRFGYLDRPVAEATRALIEATAADALAALDAAHAWLARPECRSPGEGWPRVLEELFPPSPAVADGPAGVDGGRVAARLCNAAAAFLLAERSEQEEALEEALCALHRPAQRATTTLLDYAKSGPPLTLG